MKLTMKKLFAAILILTSCGFNSISSRPDETEAPVNAPSIYDFKMKSITGEEISFDRYKGKKVLIVNVASKCGYTPQYEDLQKLHEQFGDKVIILGFPANNFASQEPGTNEEIATFCKTNYGVSFQMFEKVSVKGNDQSPLYEWLSTKELNGWNDQAPKWNFCKYLVNENGELVKFFASGVKPMSDEMLAAIQE
jgi:glutathione peroxidase